MAIFVKINSPILKKAACLVVAHLLLFSCSKDSKNEEKTLLLSDSSLEFALDGGMLEIDVTANTQWSVKYDADWFSVATSGDMGKGSIVVTVQPNYSNNSSTGYSIPERSAVMFVTTSSEEVFKEITIYQKGHTDTPLQVYLMSGLPFQEDMNVVGSLFPSGSYTPGSFTAFERRTSYIPSYLWQIEGEITEGIMAIDFPEGDFEPMFMGRIELDEKDVVLGRGVNLIKMTDNQQLKIVHILYADEDFSNESVTLRTGWNFVEIVENSNGILDNEAWYLLGVITQDINDMLENGFRWHIMDQRNSPPIN